MTSKKQHTSLSSRSGRRAWFYWGCGLILLAMLLMAKMAHAGPCVYMGGYWCELWGEETSYAFYLAGSAVVTALGGILTFFTTLLNMLVQVQILPEIASASTKAAIAFEVNWGRDKVLNEGETAMKQGKSLLYGSQIGLPGSTPASPQEAAAVAMVKDSGSEHPGRVCNTLVAQTQVTPLVSAGTGLATDAMNTRLVNSMRTSRMADAEASYLRHTSSYCSFSDVLNGLCEAAAADHMQNLDVMPPGYTKSGEAKTTQLSEEEKRAAMVWSENVMGLGNYPAMDYNEDTYNSDARKAFSGSNNAIQARLSTVAHSMNSQIARRSKVVVTFNEDNSARADVASQIADANPNLDPSSTTTGSAETQSRCSASMDFAKYEKMGSAAVNTAINNAFDGGDSGSALLNFGISRSAWHYYAFIESSKQPGAISLNKYFGLYQMSAGALADAGMSNLLPDKIFESYPNAVSAKRYAEINIKGFNKRFPNGVKGVPPVFVLYGMHNMGAAGFKDIYDNITNGTPLSTERKKAIQGNMRPRVPLEQINGQMYWEFWRKKFGVNAC